ncbi:MAG: hypothetical protein KJO02_09050, partial [Erythrobacter sp.]|nr:hypothetical protein [Erythrobacter sp.]
ARRHGSVRLSARTGCRRPVRDRPDAIGTDLRLLFGPEGIPSGLVDDAREVGLAVHAWTLRKENAYLPPMLRRGTSENGTGDVLGMVTILKAQGIDGVFTDDPGLVVSALAQ